MDHEPSVFAQGRVSNTHPKLYSQALSQLCICIRQILLNQNHTLAVHPHLETGPFDSVEEDLVFMSTLGAET